MRDLTEKEAAFALGVSRWELFRARRKGEIGFFRHGRKLTYGLHHLEAFRESREHKAKEHRERRAS